MIINPSRVFEGSDLGVGEPVLLSNIDVSDLLAELVGNVEWLSESEGYCLCPGAHLHTTKSGRKDCKLYLRPVPTLSCFHSSCHVTVAETTKRLRQSLREFTGQPQRKELTQEEKEYLAKVRYREALRRRAVMSREQILKNCAWPATSIGKASPSSIGIGARSQWHDILRLFAAMDVVWVGSLYQSGKPEHASAFRSTSEWLKQDEPPGQFICPSTFIPGSYARSNVNLATRRFLVMESDELSPDGIAAVFQWMVKNVGLRLRAIVDTAGKSLHGWFDYPAEPELDDLRVVLPGLGCDPKMFTPSQPCRVPGALRDGRLQSLLYLDAEDRP